MKVLSLVWFALCFAFVQMVAAQAPTLELLTPTAGQIEPGGTQSWQFSAAAGQVLSFTVKTQSGNLDPAFNITSSAGKLIASNDDYAYPQQTDALLQAISFPQTDTYTMTVYGVNQSAGDYTVTRLPGYGQLIINDNLNGELAYSTTTPDAQISAADGHLTLSDEGISHLGIAHDPKLFLPNDFYLQVDIDVSGLDGWITGLSLRATDDTSYLLEINQQGEWRFLLQTPTDRQILADWNTHPALPAGQGRFTLSALVIGDGFDFFYNGFQFGRIADSRLPSGEQFGIVVETLPALTSKVQVNFDNLIVTTPLLVNQQPLLAQPIIANKAQDIVRDWQRQGIIPAGGELALNIDSSFVESKKAGVEWIPLARGTQFQRLVIGGRFTLTGDDPRSGCGLVFGTSAETDYTIAYLEQSGAFGIAQRTGDSFAPGLFDDQRPASAGQHELVVIVMEATLIYYVDGQYAGSLNQTTPLGGIGNAVINGEPVNAQCSFTDTWVWRWN